MLHDFYIVDTTYIYIYDLVPLTLRGREGGSTQKAH